MTVSSPLTKVHSGRQSSSAMPDIFYSPDHQPELFNWQLQLELDMMVLYFCGSWACVTDGRGT